MQKRVIIIGGGAAGFFCAANLKGNDLSVTILEKQKHVLQKVRVSGGGRCNVTHNCRDVNIMTDAYPRGGKQLRQAFARFFTIDTVKWFEDRKVKIKAEPDGRMFPVSNRSADIIEALYEEVQKNGHKVWTESPVRSVSKTASGFEVVTDKTTLQCDKLVLAAGGFQRAEQYGWFKDLGLKLVDPVPSLFTFNVKDKSIHELAGNSVPQVTVKVIGSKTESTGPVLFTHWGFSGPAILKLSALAARELSEKNYNFSFSVNWLPRMKQDEVRSMIAEFIVSHSQKSVSSGSPFTFSSGVWKFLLASAGISLDQKWAETGKKQINALVERLSNSVFHAQGKTTFKEEFVTCGGVDLSQIDFKTMEVKGVPGLYVCGELLDIDGVTGGYNFQNAWTTGYIAAQHISGS